MRQLFSKVKKWWNDKDYRGKNMFLSSLNMALWLAFMAAIFINPWLQLGIALTLVITNAYGIFLTGKQSKMTAEEIQEQINELKKKETEERIKKYQEIKQGNLDEETKEVMKALFNSNSKTDETTKNLNKDENIESEVHTVVKFNDLFSSKKNQ